MATTTFAGPIDYAVFAFPERAPISAGLNAVLNGVAAGTIELIDIEAITLDHHARPVRMPLDELQEPGDVDMDLFVAAQAGLLDDEDVRDIATELSPGQFALVIVYEDRSLSAAADAFAHIGGVAIFSGGVDIADLNEAITKGIAP